MSDLHLKNQVMSSEEKTKECEVCHIEKNFYNDFTYLSVINATNICMYCRCKESRKRQAERYKARYPEKGKERSKKYYEKNKEKISEKGKEYREKNKEKISEKNKVKYTCGCGVILCKKAKSRHDKSQGHKKWLENKTE